MLDGGLGGGMLSGALGGWANRLMRLGGWSCVGIKSIVSQNSHADSRIETKVSQNSHADSGMETK